MPRSLSSGALSIWSNGVKGLRSGYLSCSTLVIAAVSVVLPWSMWPMVPMLTCGLVRSNLAFATGVSSLRSGPPAVGLDYSCLAAVVGRYVRYGGYSPRALATISFAMFGGTSAYESNCML